MEPGVIIEYTIGLKGSYILFIEIKQNFTVEIRKTRRELKRGFYLYVGSAFGPGGLKSRISRHIRKNKTIHWHIDKVTSHKKSAIKGIIIFSNQSIECRLGEFFSSETSFSAILGFGNTDCSSECRSHFFRIEK